MKLTKVFTIVIILITLFSLTSSVWADSKTQFIQEDVFETVNTKVDIEYIPMDPCEGFEPLNNAQIYCGIRKGAGYRIEVPDDWNGDLLMYAHGYRFGSEYLWVDDPPFREWLIEKGYAWAASSFSENGVNITAGAKDTKTLVEFFKENIATPEHIFISGESMGSGITITSVEQWPGIYDGGMPTCGALDMYEMFDAAWDYYVLANALAGYDATFPVPEDFVTSGDYAAVVEELAGLPGMYPYILNEKGEQLKNAVKMATGGERPLFDQGFTFNYGFLEIFMGSPVMQLMVTYLNEATDVQGVYVDNWDTIYQFDTDPELSPEEQALNEIVFRIQRDPQAMHPNGLKNIPVNNGKISVPVLSIHGIGDMLTPFYLEQLYAQMVAEQGASDFLVQRAIRDFVHCSFTPEEYTTAFTDLVNWVETGVKPAGDDLLDPAVVSDEYFGCEFTLENRDYTWLNPMLDIPACP